MNFKGRDLAQKMLLVAEDLLQRGAHTKRCIGETARLWELQAQLVLFTLFQGVRSTCIYWYTVLQQR